MRTDNKYYKVLVYDTYIYLDFNYYLVLFICFNINRINKQITYFIFIDFFNALVHT